MNKGKLLDFFRASNEEAADVALAEVFPVLVEQYGECVVEETLAVLAGEIVGAVFPRMNSIRLSYKQNRLESNICYLFSVMMKYQEKLEERLTVLESQQETRDFCKFATELLLDNIVDEIQKSKVNYSVNGYINLLHTENPNQDMALMFFKTLAQLNDLDIRILKLYDVYTNAETWYDIVQETGITLEQFRFVKEKLERFGLLQSKNQETIDSDLELIVKYLQALEKDNKSSKTRGEKIPKLKKLSHSDTYKLTSLGRQYLMLIEEI